MLSLLFTAWSGIFHSYSTSLALDPIGEDKDNDKHYEKVQHNDMDVCCVCKMQHQESGCNNNPLDGALNCRNTFVVISDVWQFICILIVIVFISQIKGQCEQGRPGMWIAFTCVSCIEFRAVKSDF